jgi:DNA-binding NtrC family response regulator
MGGKLILHETGAGATEFPLGVTEATLGRGAENLISLDDPKASRVHALVRSDSEGFLLLDLGSANGTFLNNRRIVTATRLRSGDVVRVGSTSFLFVEEAPANPMAELDRDTQTTLSVCADEAVLLGTSGAMVDLFRMIEKAAAAKIPVLIEGESGTGKELVASAIHQASDRAAATRVAVNCAAFTESVLESELFGHRRGAFTGATSDHPGLFETANNSTVFLDEIGAIPLALQPKLLRVLQKGEVTRVGETRPRKVDVRLIFATTGHLLADVERGSFRADLYYRLSAFPIHVPALRERRADIPLLAQRFLTMAARSQHRRARQIETSALEALGRFDWPGNVRELQNEIYRAVAVAARDGTIKLEHLSAKVVEGRSRPRSEADMAPSQSDASLSDAPRALDKTYIGEVLDNQHGDVATGATDVVILRYEGDYWTIEYDGVAGRLRNTKGLHYLSHLLRHAGREFHALDLMGMQTAATTNQAFEAGDRAPASEDLRVAAGVHGMEMLDGQAKVAYRQRLAELREELAEAEQFNDTGRVAAAREEIEAITDQLAAAVGLGGRNRHAASATERARSTVTQRIKTAIKKISERHPSLADHLARVVKTGTFCAYQPDPAHPIRWDLDGGAVGSRQK